MQHAFNVQGSAALGVLAFLGTAAVLAACAVSWVVLRATRRRPAARRVARSAGIVVAGYAAALALFSLTSRSVDLPVGDEKYFCGIDCHLAYSVAGAETLPPTGPASSEAARSDGTVRVVVRVRVRFDPSTISAHRGDSLLTPNPRHVALLGSDGREYPPSEAGLRDLTIAPGPQPSLDRQLRPGESYVAPIVFDLPPGVSGGRVLVTEGDPVTRVLIGHENSPWHGKAGFLLPAATLGARR